jgi:hypothetical protein
MHPFFAAQIIADRRNILLHQAAIEHLVRDARAQSPTRRNRGWQLQSPIVRRPRPTSLQRAVCR